MKTEAIGDLLKQLRSELERALGDQMAGLYLYGSQARGDARPDSDIGVTVISLAFVSRHKFLNPKSPFLLNIRQESIAL